MDDIMNMLQNALNDPETAGKLGGLLSSIGGMGGEAGEGSQAPAEQSSEPMLPDISKLMQMSSLLQTSGSQDSSVALLHALRPLLKEETQIKLDRVIKIFRLMSAYPMIRDSGLLEML